MVLANVAVPGAASAGRVQASMRDGFRESLATLGLGLENRLGDRIGLLSGGQRQAVSLLDGGAAAVAYPCCSTNTPRHSTRAPPTSSCISPHGSSPRRTPP